jgi:hypothetical protein
MGIFQAVLDKLFFDSESAGAQAIFTDLGRGQSLVMVQMPIAGPMMSSAKAHR